MRRHVIRMHSESEIKWIALATGEIEIYNPATSLTNTAPPCESETTVFDRRTAATSTSRSRAHHSNQSAKTKRKKNGRQKRLSITKKYLSCDPWSSKYRSEEEDEDEDEAEEEQETEERHEFHEEDRGTANENEDSDDTIIEDTVDEPSVDVNRSFSSMSSDVLQLHCHLCSYSVKTSSPSALFRHYRTDHKTLCSIPHVEVTDMLTC